MHKTLALASPRRFNWVISAVLSVLVAAACSGNADNEFPASASGQTLQSGGSATEFTMTFAGDVHFMRRTASLLEHPKTAIGPIAKTLSTSDLTLLNLETAITTRGTAEPKRYLFRTDRRAVKALRAAGVEGHG